jgi:hypothetical protein
MSGESLTPRLASGSDALKPPSASSGRRISPGPRPDRGGGTGAGIALYLGDRPASREILVDRGGGNPDLAARGFDDVEQPGGGQFIDTRPPGPANGAELGEAVDTLL